VPLCCAAAHDSSGSSYSPWPAQLAPPRGPSGVTRKPSPGRGRSTTPARRVGGVSCLIDLGDNARRHIIRAFCEERAMTEEVAPTGCTTQGSLGMPVGVTVDLRTASLLSGLYGIGCAAFRQEERPAPQRRAGSRPSFRIRRRPGASGEQGIVMETELIRFISVMQANISEMTSPDSAAGPCRAIVPASPRYPSPQTQSATCGRPRAPQVAALKPETTTFYIAGVSLAVR
jgi:hypothetical protein